MTRGERLTTFFICCLDGNRDNFEVDLFSLNGEDVCGDDDFEKVFNADDDDGLHSRNVCLLNEDPEQGDVLRDKRADFRRSFILLSKID